MDRAPKTDGGVDAGNTPRLRGVSRFKARAIERDMSGE